MRAFAAGLRLGFDKWEPCVNRTTEESDIDHQTGGSTVPVAANTLALAYTLPSPHSGPLLDLDLADHNHTCLR